LLLPEDDARDIFCECCAMAASRFSRVERTSLFRQLADAPMKLTAYVLDGHEVAIRPAPVDREWMEATNERFAYRCLPLNIANAHGWEILCRSGFSAVWNGSPGLDAVKIEPDPGTTAPAISHFGHGILTFHVNCLFRTDPGFDLMAQGPINRPKHGIAPLSGVIETDWASFTFTMNWICTLPNVQIRFNENEPFCHIFPIRRGELEAVEPQILPISANPELQRELEEWRASRGKFNQDLKQPGSQAREERWQKMYYRGLDAGGESTGAEDHRTRVRLRSFSSNT